METRPPKPARTTPKSSTPQKQTPENFVKDVRRKARRIFSSEQKILIVMEALRGEDSVAAICRKHDIAESVFYKWNKEFLEAGKKRFSGDTTREATSDEVAELRKENQKLNEMVAGYTYNTTAGNNDFALARFNEDGSLDSTFSEDGKQTTDFGFGDASAQSISIVGDQIVVAGQADNGIPGSSDFAVARYNEDGSLDSTFSEDGLQRTDFEPGNDYAYSVAIQEDKIVVADRTYDHTTNATDFALARYNGDGTLDSTFSEDGLQTTDFRFSIDEAFSVAIQGNQILVAGSAYNPATGRNDYALARYNRNGTIDRTFGEDGLQTTDFGFGSTARSIAIQGDRIIAGGSAGESLALVRYTSTGSLDSTFGIDGIQKTVMQGSSFLNKIALRGNRLYAIGSVNVPANGSFGLVAAFQLESPEAPPVVSSFTLVDASTDKDLGALEDGAVIDLESIGGKSINIRVATLPDTVGSVVVKLRGRQWYNSIENSTPYAVFGNTGADYKAWQPAAGTYTLTATPYSGKDSSGTKGTPLTIRFSVMDKPVLTHFTLVNAGTNKSIDTLRDGQVIDLALHPEINIRANRQTLTVESVVFGVNSNANYSVQNSSPFALASDNKGDYLSWKVAPGTYTITATPYTQNDAQGTSDSPISVTITVINSNAVVAPALTHGRQQKGAEVGMLLQVLPNPVRGSAVVQFRAAEAGSVSVVLVGAGGRVVQQVFSGRVERGAIYTRNLNVAPIASGVYYCRLQTEQGKVLVTKVVTQ